MSFFISCPISNAVPGPDKSGHQPPCCMIVKPALHVCPDLRGTLIPPVKGHEIKKDISMLFHIQFLRRVLLAIKLYFLSAGITGKSRCDFPK